jgi:hypothetical protein
MGKYGTFPVTENRRTVQKEIFFLWEAIFGHIK